MSNRIPTVILGLVAVATFVYPFAVYAGINIIGAAGLSLILLCLLIARVIVRGDFDKPEQYAQLLLVGSLCILAAWRNSEAILRYYPVAMSLGFSAFFLLSLNAEMTLVERFARVFMDEIEQHQRRQ